MLKALFFSFPKGARSRDSRFDSVCCAGHWEYFLRFIDRSNILYWDGEAREFPLRISSVLHCTVLKRVVCSRTEELGVIGSEVYALQISSDALHPFSLCFGKPSADIYIRAEGQAFYGFGARECSFSVGMRRLASGCCRHGSNFLRKQVGLPGLRVS